MCTWSQLIAIGIPCHIWRERLDNLNWDGIGLSWQVLNDLLRINGVFTFRETSKVFTDLGLI